MKTYITFFSLILLLFPLHAQIVINEGSNKNYSTVADEDGEFEDWIELYNAGASPLDLYNYSLTDRASIPAQWVFPHYVLPAGAYKVIFCSDKNRMASEPFSAVANVTTFTPQQNWNTHNLTAPFYWDGVSNLLINVCSYSGAYTVNSIFRQSSTAYPSTIYAFEDYSAASCNALLGTVVNQRPNMQLNGLTVGTGNIQNGPNDYPAPYGNWYWGARHQMLITAAELTAAGLSAGNITSLAFDVVTADPCVYDYIDISMKATSVNALSNNFAPMGGNNFHTNFKISSNGETIQLYNPGGSLQSSLLVNCPSADVSKGSLPDASANIALFLPATPSATNNTSQGFSGQALPPVFSMASAVINSPIYVSISNPNGTGSEVRYTLDGSDPTPASMLYTAPIFIFQRSVLKAKAFVPGTLASTISGASYLMSVSHQTPILSLYTDNANLYGPNGNFDNPFQDWLKAVQVDYFDAAPNHNLVFSQNSGMIQDGGAGGSRGAPQRSFRLELDHNIVGEGPVQEVLIPRRPNRNKYSKLYFRNGSNQFLVMPQKDATQVEMMAGETNNYYSAMQPVTVYVNGEYFGLYEMREKFDTEYFEEHDNANGNTVDIMSLSYYYNSVLRSVEGAPVDSFFSAYNAVTALNPADTGYWSKADRYFDMQWYNDYIIAESWTPNVDWPQNNIKIYRSNASGNRFRFCLIDLELSFGPNGWTDCQFDHINYMLNYSTANPYINIWQHSLQNDRFRDYFINRFADLMNTSYDTSRLRRINQEMFYEMVVEMPNEYARWGGGNIQQQMNDFYRNYLVLDSQLVCRTAAVRDDIQAGFSLPGQVEISLDVYPAASGNILISTVTPENYPVTWVYFDGVPVKLQATPAPGYRFSHWENNAVLSDTLNPVFSDTLSSDLLFRAHFEAIPAFVPQTEDIGRNFTLYPNPATSTITIKAENPNLLPNAYYEIISVDGRVLEKGKLPAESVNEFSVAHLPEGFYFFKISDAETALNRLIKFVKMN